MKSIAIHFAILILNKVEVACNVITLGQTKSDNINRMIALTDDFYLVIFTAWNP